MKRCLCCLLLVALTHAGCALFEPPSKPVSLAPEIAAKIRGEIEKDRAETREWLRGAPTSYLAAIDRIDFNEKETLTVGRAPDNDLRLEDPGIELHHLRVTVAGPRFRIQCIDPKAGFKVKGEPKREAILDPSSIGLGRYTLRLSHQRFPAIIVFDPQSPRFKEYKEVAYFPVDLSYRYELPVKLYSEPKKTIIMSTRGNQRSAETVGWVDFLVRDTQCRLEVTRLLEPGSGENELAIFFRDASSGKETYPLGRYVDLKRSENGKYILDFNQAYNPACAFSDFYNCPIPPKDNNLKVEIRAGEKDPHYH